MNDAVFSDVILIFAQIIQAALNILFYSAILTPKYSVRRCFAGMMLIQTAYLCTAQIISLDNLFRWLGAVLLQLLIGRIFFRNFWKMVIFSVGVLYILAFTGEFTAELFIRIVFPDQYGLPSPVMRAAGNAFFCVPYALCILLFRQFWKRNEAKMAEKNIYATLFFPVLPFFLLSAVAYFLLVCLSRWNNVLVPAINVISGALFCVGTAVIMFRMFSEMTKKDQLADQLKLLERQSRLELAYYTALDEKTREVRRLKHDFNNQLQTAYSIFAQGNHAEARTYLSQLEQRVRETGPAYYCANPIVNAILWDKEKTARDRGVTFQAKVSLSEQTGLAKVDLCSVFSNLLDNAIEAAGCCAGGRVSVQAYVQGGYCVVRVENSISENRDIVSGRKEKKPGHGYGIPILKSICEKYDGTYSAGQRNGCYQAVIMLKSGNSAAEGGEQQTFQNRKGERV